LPRDTGHHNINTNVGEVLGVGARGDSTTGSLEEEGEEVATDEDGGVCACTEARNLFAVGNDDPRKTKVDCCRKKGGSNSETDEIPGFD
jgi:hypothetical protein